MRQGGDEAVATEYRRERAVEGTLAGQEARAERERERGHVTVQCANTVRGHHA